MMLVCDNNTIEPKVDLFHSIAELLNLGGNLALQLLFLRASESMGNHDSRVVDADSVD
jgi:hypothetical protein